MNSAAKKQFLDIKQVENLYDSAVPVKNNPVREVRRNQEFFIKFDHRPNHGFSREFSAAEKLKKAGLPVVEHVFCGKSERGNFLVTRSFADSVSVEEYLRSNVPEMSFFETIADLACNILKSGFLHSDFHLGNLLYSESKQTFALVDVRKVRSMPQWIINSLPESSRFHVLTEFRGVLRKTQLLSLFNRVGIADPREFYEEMFTSDNLAIRDEWPRRRKQILSGYPKFTRCVDKILFNSNASDADIASAVEISGGKAVFLAGFFLDLIQIPHRKLVKYDPVSDTAYAVPETKEMSGGEAAIEMLNRLSYYDIISSPHDWRNVNECLLPHLSNLQQIADQPFVLGE